MIFLSIFIRKTNKIITILIDKYMQGSGFKSQLPQKKSNMKLTFHVEQIFKK